MNELRQDADRAAPRIAILFGLLVAVAFLLARLPYRGLRHDGVLYAGQALAHLNPAWAASDFYFSGGSQDRYSIFSNVVARLISHFSIGATDIALLLGAWALFLWALFALGRELAPRERWLGVVCVVCVSHFYGATRIFGYMETFVTARTWAEPLALVALALLTRSRYALAALFLGLSLVVHPLIAVPALAVCAAYLVSVDRRWAWAFLLLVPLVALAALGIAPFAGLLQSYDEVWFQASMRESWSVFLSTWGRMDFTAAATVLGVLWLSSRGQSTPLARLNRAAVWATLVLCAISFIGADTQHNVLITQLQLWRVLWIADVLAMVSLPAWLAREWAKGGNGQLAAVAVFVAVFTVDTWLATGWAMVLWAVLALALGARAAPLKPRVLRLAIGATLFAGFAMTGLQVFNDQAQLSMHRYGLAIASNWSIPAQMPMFTLPLAFVLLSGWTRAGAARNASLVAALAILVAGATHWDQRTAWSKYIESAAPGRHPFAALIPAGAQVYWHEDTPASWILLQRPQFISDFQLSGLLFSRATAMTGINRAPALAAISVDVKNCEAFEWYGADSRQIHACTFPRAAFFDMCHQKPDHADFLVGPVDLGAGVVSRWTFEPSDGSAPVSYALYDCKKTP